PGGWIGIMTQRLDDAPEFAQWFYKDDSTHLCFFSRKSFQWLEKEYGLRAEFHPLGVILFQTLENQSAAAGT
ncbi:MAG: 2-polyprenyl-3-methyl-5-hydroxy-6-metoxy-1,4-benzoquinol methylase, partial [Kiritimatiellales bacterium]